jgi:hypothetical protein
MGGSWGLGWHLIILDGRGVLVISAAGTCNGGESAGVLTGCFRVVDEA